MSEKLEFRHSENTLAIVCLDAAFVQSLENLMEVSQMLLWGVISYQNTVYMDELSGETSKHFVNKAWKSLIPESIRTYSSNPKRVVMNVFGKFSSATDIW